MHGGRLLAAPVLPPHHLPSQTQPACATFRVPPSPRGSGAPSGHTSPGHGREGRGRPGGGGAATGGRVSAGSPGPGRGSRDDGGGIRCCEQSLTGERPALLPSGGRRAQNWLALLGSHCSSRTMDGSLLAPLMNSSRDSLPSLLVSICLKILSVRFSGVDSSSGIFITEDTIL